MRRVATARRMRLAVDPATGTVRLTMPPRANETRARAWADGQRGWIEAQLARLPRARPIADGGTIPFRGGDLEIAWVPGHARAPRLDGGRLFVGGPPDRVGARVRAWLRGEAARLLAEATRALAQEAGVTVGRVTVGDPRARWGSCSARGDIRYSWRLILAPDPVWQATVAHEVAHRLHMNHGAAFRDTERRLFAGDLDAARRWLRQHGAGLHWVGRTA